MTWETFYLVCFIVGFALAVIGFLGGALHIPHLHLPGFHAHGGGHAGAAGTAISPFNFPSLMAFLAWFGGVGYLLTTRGNMARLIVLVLALTAGTAGASLVFGFLTRVLLRHERALDAADFEMVGVLGRVTVGIRAGGTGEIVYSQEGTRRSSGARSESQSPIARGSEVVVTRYERGIAYVRPWEEMAGLAAPAEYNSSETEKSDATSTSS
jgi:membrane protein implicated in regulation of membrane protease activity